MHPLPLLFLKAFLIQGIINKPSLAWFAMSIFQKQNFFYNHFPTPEYLTLSTSGIAITDESIHFIQFRHGLVGRGLKLSHYKKIVLPRGVVESGFINNAEKLTTILKEIKERYKLSHIRATLPEERAYLFTATIDKVPPEGLRDAVAFIIEENVPVTLADSVFDFDVLDVPEEPNKLKVIVSAISNKVVDFYLPVFEAAGITPVSLDIESQAIARATVALGDKSVQLILNLGKQKTGLYVVEDEIVQFTTTLPYGIDENSTHLSDLKTEIKKIFVFWAAHDKSSSSDHNIKKVLLCGTASLDHSFATSFMSECPVPYEWVNPWVNLSSTPMKLPQNLVKEALDYVPAIGLTIPHPHRTYV